MKSIQYILFTLALALFMKMGAQTLSPYILVGENSLSLEATEDQVRSALENKGFELIGSYHVEGNQTLKSIVFTRKDLKDITIQVEDRGALASALKVGLKSDGPGTTISYLNPEYLFQAYLMDAYDKHASGLGKVESDVASALSPLGSVNQGFGGGMTAEDLREYHYKIMMPYFTDPVELEEFSSFEEGVKMIEKNLKAKKGKTLMVYSIKYPGKQVAVYGVGLMDEEEGEKHFLPIIGEEHLAAMPYEIILQGKTATMLHGRYRIALHWPDLTMGTFTKIMSTPGDVKKVMKGLCKQ
jgi:hypothetical protein